MNDGIPRAVDLGGLCDVVVSLELHTGSCEFIFMLVKTKKHMKRNRPNKQRQVRMATFAQSRMRMANADGEWGWRTNAPTYFMAPFARCCLVECRMKIYLADTSHFSDFSPVYPARLSFPLSLSSSPCVPPAAVHCAYVACAASIKRSSLGLALHLVYYVDEERGGEGVGAWEDRGQLKYLLPKQ